MVQVSSISDQIKQLNHDISDFECQLASKNKRICGSDCYCRKEGNHKVTNSLYHKNCISMKKGGASVTKADLVQSRNKSLEKRKEVINLGRAQVELSLKNPVKEKVIYDGHLRQNYSEKPRRLVDIGTDPITIVEPKKKSKKCWGAVLSENSKNDLLGVAPAIENMIFEPPEKLQPYSSATATPSIEKEPIKKTVMVRDRGIQCQKGSDDIRSPINVKQHVSSSNPIFALQSLLKDLRTFKRNLRDESEKNSLCSIISDMDHAVERLMHSPSTVDGRINGFYEPMKDRYIGSKSQFNSLDNLQETCQQLQVSCLKLEQTCQKLQKEKDHVTEKFFEKSRELEGCLKRELEYQTKLNDVKQSGEIMSQKLDKYRKTMEDLTLHITKLQAENKALESAEETKNKLLKQLLEAAKENEKLNNEIQLMSLEREKNIVLLDIKEQELTKLKSELRSIGGLVSEKMLETVMAGDSLLMSSRFDISDSREIVFSSPDGTMVSPSKSWKAVSSIISPDPVKKVEPSRKIKMGVPILSVKQLGKKDPELKDGDANKKNPLESINHLKNELRELFAQMKQQTELSETVQAAGQGSDLSHWSTLTDSSNGYNSISENELSDVT